MTDAIFSIENLSIDSTRGGERTRIVDGLSLSVRPGEVYGLVGESGSGKSISMMTAVGLAAPGLDVVSGEVTFDGTRRDARDQRALRRPLSHGAALLFQNAKGALTPFLTAGRQVERTLRKAGHRRNLRSEVTELFRVVGLNHADHGHKYPHQISGGQAQRVAMACALATNPRLLIADEPTTALDVTTEGELLRFLTGLCRERDLAIVLIAHNLSLVSEHCARLSIMHAGQLVETGERDRIFATPLHPYTNGLIEAVPDLDAPRELVPLKGTVWGGPPGHERCRFSHRCPHAKAACDAGRPPEVTRPGQTVHCILHAEEPA
ncbi:ABC transporter ATP-binding protein [Pelagovum pacificum]|uniref:ABC transporter ATP-binding protein n=1 Tax=Pelagovum pacificum TaxID=2588711 RepID=A0A5C5GC08_9RHOB|nr:ABC transporter ATP-binding protein [Pelagovum pacificum]QQA44703.1 ABC transporter ATP-binding protein [Pelagovum pacificum]TNY32188.1 ABC transporter ATP-binding protein [Pelagovum pacificum]